MDIPINIPILSDVKSIDFYRKYIMGFVDKRFDGGGMYVGKTFVS